MRSGGHPGRVADAFDRIGHGHGTIAHRQQAAHPKDCRRRGRAPGDAEGSDLSAQAAARAERAVRLPIELVDTAALPDGGTLRLLRCGAEYSIRFGSDELMGSEFNGSEKALAALACRRLNEAAPRVLIGGLGMGFTLNAARSALPEHASIVVAELVPQVVAWARGPLAHLFDDALGDPRVAVEIADVHDVIDRSPDGFDAILLDVDNGPDGLIHLPNERLYCNWGLRAAHKALRAGGVLGVWSAYADEAFADRIAQAGFAVEEMRVRSTGGRTGARHRIWLGARQPNSAG